MTSTAPQLTDRSNTPTSDSDKILTRARRNLRKHIGLGPVPGDPCPEPPEDLRLFFVEVAPYSHNGARCKLSICGSRIQPGHFRFAVSPGMGQNKWSAVDLYHIRCFELIADFSQVEFIDRVWPLTRRSWMFRGLAASSVFDANYLVSGGIERLVLEWKVRRGQLIDERDGRNSQEDLDPDFCALLQRAGSATFKCTTPSNIDRYEYRNLAVTLAPFESDGPGDTNEWNLFDRYLRVTPESLLDPHNLSSMIERWKTDVNLAMEGDPTIDPKTVKALKRLSAIPMPRNAFYGSIYE